MGDLRIGSQHHQVQAAETKAAAPAKETKAGKVSSGIMEGLELGALGESIRGHVSALRRRDAIKQPSDGTLASKVEETVQFDIKGTSLKGRVTRGKTKLPKDLFKRHAPTFGPGIDKAALEAASTLSRKILGG